METRYVCNSYGITTGLAGGTGFVESAGAAAEGICGAVAGGFVLVGASD
jgi:hypothetical protein